MAAGIPVVVSDWDGYRYTVTDGVEGFLIPTLAPSRARQGVELALSTIMASFLSGLCWCRCSACCGRC